MKIAYSPCPNDTFIFHALAHGLVPGAPAFDVTYADIDMTNHWAIERKGPEILKISYAALPFVLPDYALLPCGGALGRGCGPLVLTKEERSPRDLIHRSIAVPSELSTAYLLFRLWAAQHQLGDKLDIRIMPFHEIMPAVRDGKVDAGLVIHEARFTYSNYHLNMLADLGAWWEKETGLPIPLGAIIARRSLDVQSLTEWIRASVHYAWENPQASRPYALHHAQEMDPAVVEAHINLYVNEFSSNLGEEGYAAIRALLGRAAEEGLVPEIDEALLRSDAP